MTPKSLPSISLLALIFGSTLIVSRFSVGQYAPLTYVSLRLLLGGLCYMLVYALSGGRAWPRERRIWRYGPLYGLIGTALPMSCIVGSLQYQSSGITALLLTSAPAFTVILAHFFLPDERLNGRKIVGVGLAMSGASALVLLGENGLPDTQQANPLGYALAVGGIMFGSVGTIYARRYLRDFDSIDITSVRLWTALAILIPIAYIVDGLDLSRVGPSGYMALLYAGLIGTFAGLQLEFRIIQRFGATASAITANLIPIVALFGGRLFLDEHISPTMVLAMIVIILGVSIITRSESADLAVPIES
ncbi:MAG: DMT family transporter [Candidatus Promineifilaceae bacterium]